MVTSKIKPSQLTRAGYSYQDLMCIRILIDWFHDPKKYQWMSIEGNDALGSIKSLDDVICFTKNSEYELYQVKFTIDPDREDLKLDFDWLLKKKPKGTSLIQKWSADFEKFGSSHTISIAKLLTNRMPDPILAGCLINNKINYNLIPEDIKVKILAQLDDERLARMFFDNLIFEHSQQEIDGLELKLQDSLVPDHANNESWFQLLKTVERWATRKNEPTPDGKIHLKHIHEILSLGSKRTISQFFEVPGGYTPPTEDFHKEIFELTTKPGCSVISGLPGMGKSTYLSFLTDKLLEKKVSVIRHHYYLSPHFVGDRIAYNNAAQSLQSQLKSLYPTDFGGDEIDAQYLDTWISKAADIASESDETLVVIIDGLDHVYRERSDISQLEHLVNRLVPLKDKVCLLYGTQPISDEHLPNSLLSSAPRKTSWKNIPTMGLDAIKSRLDFLVQVDEIDIDDNAEQNRNEVVDVSEALLIISKGYPLHIIYSLNSLKLAGNRIRKYDVERLPTCPEGNIYTYYENLWVSLSENAKEILILIATADFSWPNETHIGFCFEDSLIFRKSFAETQHLIERRLSGITPFHNSLLVYLKQKDEFINSGERVNQKLKNWIDLHAPDYWKWGWGWVIESKLGNTSALLNGITREWLVDSLCKAYPLEHIERIINIAEEIAFEESRYPELLRLRKLKLRLLNGPEFQIQDFSEFLDCSLSCSSDTFGLLWRADNLRIIPDSELVIVAKHFQGKDERIINECAIEVYRRIKFYAQLDDSNHYQTIDRLVDCYLRVLVSYDHPDMARVGEFYDKLNDKSSPIRRIAELLIQFGHRHALLDLLAFDIPDDVSWDLTDEVILTASVEGVSIRDIYPKLSISNSNLGLLYLFLNGEDISSQNLVELKLPDDNEAFDYHLFYQFFFSTLASDLKGSEAIKETNLTEATSVSEFVDNILLTFEYAASVIAKNLRASEKFEISQLYECFDILAEPDQFRLGYKVSSALFNTRKSLVKIAINLCILCNSSDEVSMLGEDNFPKASESFWWNSRIFFDVAAQNSICDFPVSVTAPIFDSLLESEVHRREDTATLANDSIELGLIATKHGLDDHARLFLERATLNIVGYGHRKDTTLHEVFDAIEKCSSSSCSEVPDWLRRLTVFVTDVFDFSEREIRHIPDWFTKLLSKHNPERLVDEFDYHLSEENWYRTDCILKNIIRAYPLSSQSEYSFLRCMTTTAALSALRERANNNIVLSEIYEEQSKVLGGMPPSPREKNLSKESDESVLPDITSIQPNNLEELKSALKSASYKIHKQFISNWVAHWIEQNEGATILNSFNTHYEQEKSDYELDRCLHEIFLLSRKIEGKTKAYKWAIRDVKFNNCWSQFFSGSRAEESLRIYGSIYKNKWESILRDTMSSGPSRFDREETILVPSNRLVTYLIAANQTSLAAKVTEAMVSSLEGDIAHLPLSELYWYRQPISLETAPLHLIFIYYKWPDRYARLQTAKQISMLLQDDSNIEFRALYLDFLSKQNYEVDVIDYLSVLSLLDNPPFNNEEIIQNLSFPSLLSDELLLEMEYTDRKREDLTTLYSEFSEDFNPNRAKYKRYANGLALRYLNTIERLGEEHKESLVNHFLLEWEQIQERHSCYVFDPYDFCGDQFYRQDKIMCSFSWVAESSILSAYLRTLAFAINHYSIPVEVALGHCKEVLPFNLVGISLSPSEPPGSWPKLDDLIKDEAPPTQNELEGYLREISISNEVLLHANGPVLRNHTGVCIDLRTIVVSLDDVGINDPRGIFDSINHSRNTEEGIFPLAKWTWPSSFGRWEDDWLSRGYFLPTYSVGDLRFKSAIQNISSVEFFVGTVSNGIWKYWVDKWYPAHLAGVGNSLGTCMVVSRDFFDSFKEQHSDRSFHLIAEMTYIDKRGFNCDQTPVKTYAMLQV